MVSNSLCFTSFVAVSLDVILGAVERTTLVMYPVPELVAKGKALSLWHGFLVHGHNGSFTVPDNQRFTTFKRFIFDSHTLDQCDGIEIDVSWLANAQLSNKLLRKSVRHRWDRLLEKSRRDQPAIGKSLELFPLKFPPLFAQPGLWESRLDFSSSMTEGQL